MITLYILGLCLTLVYGGPTYQHDGSSMHTATCPSYCDVFGRYRPSKICTHHSEVYCCGYENYLYCCDDPTLDVSDRVPTITTCPGSDFWYHWRMSISLISTMLFIMMCTACCYYCCIKSRMQSGSTPVWWFTTREQAVDVPSVSQTVTLPDGSQQQVFDPRQAYAFAPPQYDTLPKEPPKYAEVTNGTYTVQNNNITTHAAPTSPPRLGLHAPPSPGVDGTTALDDANSTAGLPPPSYTETSGSNATADGQTPEAPSCVAANAIVTNDNSTDTHQHTSAQQ